MTHYIINRIYALFLPLLAQFYRFSFRCLFIFLLLSIFSFPSFQHILLSALFPSHPFRGKPFSFPPISSYTFSFYPPARYPQALFLMLLSFYASPLIYSPLIQVHFILLLFLLSRFPSSCLYFCQPETSDCSGILFQHSSGKNFQQHPSDKVLPFSLIAKFSTSLFLAS